MNRKLSIPENRLFTVGLAQAHDVSELDYSNSRGHETLRPYAGWSWSLYVDMLSLSKVIGWGLAQVETGERRSELRKLTMQSTYSTLLIRSGE